MFLVAHGYDPDAVRPNGLMLAYPVITSGPLAHRGSFDSLLGERRNDSQALESVSIERHIDAKTPPGFRMAYRSRRNRAIRKHTDADRRLQESRSQHRSAPIPARRAWTVVGTAETAWQGVNGIEPSIQIWPQLAVSWMRRTFAR